MATLRLLYRRCLLFLLLPRPQKTPTRCPHATTAAFSTTCSLPSGHSRWSKIKHDKGKADARRGTSFSRLSQDISAASRDGGPIPGDQNLRLTAAIAAAKRAGLPKEKIATAIERGQGRSPSGAALENVTIEAMAPGGVAMLVECSTDKKLRTLQDLRLVLSKGACSVTPTAYLFERRGVVRVQCADGTEAGGVERLLEAVVEVEGAADWEEVDGGEVVVMTSVAGFVEAEAQIRAVDGVVVVEAGVQMVPNKDTVVKVDAGRWGQLEALREKLEEDGDVSGVWINAVLEKEGGGRGGGWGRL